MEKRSDQIYGVLAIWNDIDPQNENDYHEWYFQEHLLERLHIPGFLTAVRYEGVGPGPKFFTYYLTTSIEILKSPAYLERINKPTEWTRRNMAFFRNMNRTACRQTVDLGRGIGCAAITLEIKPGPDREEDLRRKIGQVLFPDLLASPGKKGLIRARLWEGDPEITIQRTRELALRGGGDKMVDWVLVIESSSLDQAEKGRELLLKYPLIERGGEMKDGPFIYKLLHYLPAPEGR